MRPGQTIVSSHYWREEALTSIKVAPRILFRLDETIRDEYLQEKINPSLIANAYADPNYFIKMLDRDNFAYALKSTELRLKKFKKRCSKNKPVIIVLIPSGILVTKEVFPYRQGLGYNVDEGMLSLDLDSPLKKIAEEQGFIYVSPLSFFRKDACFSCFYP